MLTAESTNLRNELQRRLKGTVLLVGIGNSMRGDDGSGPKLIELLEGKVKAGVLDVGEVPESYTGKILAAQPDTIVLIDAADFGGAPGDLAILEPEKFNHCALSTHQMPLGLFCHYIRENSHADLFALGIQAAEIGLGKPMSQAVTRSVQYVASLLQELLP